MTCTEAPVTTTSVADRDEAEAYLAEHAGDGAEPLTALAAQMDDDLHLLLLAPATRTVWYAWDGEPVDVAGWTIEQLTPKGAAELLDRYIDMVEDRFENPEWYDGDHDRSENDQDVMDEYTAILRLGLPADPAAAAAQIKRERELVTRLDARWQRTYANLMREVAGPARGGNVKAAAILGITEVQVGRIITKDVRRREALDEAVAQAAPDATHLDEPGDADRR
ncbi:hypothetical protein BIV57_00445 [Mangrovactinospora gilvigrisea]|uniref:Uncharacterized protein n=1 Tax=Mangrovactinospora gilvigrisea TaxID=1428644 RepID=A0A1J7BL24_9ACTN|nr:hypothetical protein [Mangrovactinospora gilvigrisea]OIV39350.1 hypothetical protein BIV57_00445 [Mangrovactinospora gilvigrisea]